MEVSNSNNGLLTYLNDESISAVMLDHKALIDYGYNCFNEGEKAQVKLSEKLFIFRPRSLSAKNKRKRKLEEIASDVVGTELILTVKTAASKILAFCGEKGLFPPSKGKYDDAYASELLCSDNYELPTLKGGNNTEQTVRTHVGLREYIIPPRCKFFCNTIENIRGFIPSTETFDLIVMDPPWWNKYIRRAKASSKGQSGYKMLENESIAQIPIEEFIHENSIVLMWCTNSPMHHKAAEDTFLSKWKLRLLSKWVWIKLNSDHKPICDFNRPGQKQPFEQLFVMCSERCKNEEIFRLIKRRFLVSVASTIHSHKPPLLELFRDYLPENPKCLEMFARYLHPFFTSIGLEVLKLQETFFYED